MVMNADPLARQFISDPMQFLHLVEKGLELLLVDVTKVLSADEPLAHPPLVLGEELAPGLRGRIRRRLVESPESRALTSRQRGMRMPAQAGTTRRFTMDLVSSAATLALLTVLTMTGGLAAGCGDGDSGTNETKSTPADSADPLATASVDGFFEVSDDGRRLKLTCWGEGSPTVVLDSGHPDGTGIADFGSSEFARALATETRVCAYDRAGWGASDPAPNEPRSADDVVEDLHALLDAADVDGPFVLAGSSFGGMIVSYYAERYPDDVEGVVLLDVPAPSATLSAKEIPEIAWDHPANPEHLDIGPEFENRFANTPPSFPAPLVVVTATGGDSSAEDQQAWLQSSADARQIELTGGHEIYLDDPAGAAAEVITLLNRE